MLAHLVPPRMQGDQASRLMNARKDRCGQISFLFFFNPWQLSRPCRQPFSPHPNIVPESISLPRIGIKDRVHPDLPESCFPARSMQGITTHDSLHSRNSPFLVLLSSVGPGVQICIRLRAVFFFTILDSCSTGSHPTPVPQHWG